MASNLSYTVDDFDRDDQLFVIGGVTDLAFLDCKVDILNLDENKSAKAVQSGLKALEVGVGLASMNSLPKTDKMAKKYFKKNIFRHHRESISYRPVPDPFYSNLTNH